MTFDIVAEAHSGVAECEEEVIAKVIEATDAAHAMQVAAEKDPRIKYIKSWDGWIIGAARKVFARETKGTSYG